MDKMKGVTPVVATVLLMAITVAAAGTIYTMVQQKTASAKQNIQEIDSVIMTKAMSFETCYNKGGDTHIVVRNTLERTINASDITPLLNGSIQRNFEVEPEIVGPQETFTINTTEKFGPETLVILTNGENKAEYSCYGL